MQANSSSSGRTALSAQSSGTPSTSTISSAGKQQVVELSGYVIILVENVEGKIKLYGSPPDRDNLEVGDEILEVNGLTLDNISRTEVIRHIHDCIKSCTICLRVRKKNDTRLAWDIGNSVQDAFVIAVEEHARERLQRLAALNRVTPVDITQLSKKLQQTKSGAQTTKQDLSFLHEASPIYVTSFTSNQITCSSSTVTTATAGLITSSTVAPTAATATTSITAATAATAVSASPAAAGLGTAPGLGAGPGSGTAPGPPSATASATAADRNANSTTTAIVGATAAAAVAAAAATKLANHHNIYQQHQPLANSSSSSGNIGTTAAIITGKQIQYQQQLQQQQQQIPPDIPTPTIASSLKHLAVAEEEDDDEDAAVGANYCSINYINYNNKHAQIPTPTTATAAATATPTAAATPIKAAATAAAATAATKFNQQQSVIITQQQQQQQQQQQRLQQQPPNHPHQYLQQQQQQQHHRPPPLQLPSAIYVDAQTSTSPLTATVVDGTTTPTTEYSTAISSSQLQKAIEQQQLYNNNNNFTTTVTIHQPHAHHQQQQVQLQQLQLQQQQQQQQLQLQQQRHDEQQHFNSTLSNNNNNSSNLAPAIPTIATATSSLPSSSSVSSSPLIAAGAAGAAATSYNVAGSHHKMLTATLSSSSSCAAVAPTVASASANAAVSGDGIRAAEPPAVGGIAAPSIGNNISSYNTTTTSYDSNFSSNCDLLVPNNVHPPRRELLTTLNEDVLNVDGDNCNNPHLYEQQQQQQQQQIPIPQNQLKGSPNSSISKGRTELLLGDQTLRQEVRPRRRSGSSIVVIDGDDLKPCLPDDYISSQHYRQHSGDCNEIDQEMLTMLSVNQDNGPHREMAVDCPDNFIARNKTPPRYPPPHRPPQQPKQTPTPHHSTTATTNTPTTTTTTTTATQHQHQQTLTKSKFVANNNPNGQPAQLADDLDELLADGLYRKDSTSQSSSFDEALSKKSTESFDSISYRNMNHNNNNGSSSPTSSTTTTMTTTTSMTSQTISPTSPLIAGAPTKHANGAIVSGTGTGTGTGTSTGTGSEIVSNGGLTTVSQLSSCGGSLNSTRSSGASSTALEDVVGVPPPEYELRELNANILLPLPPVVRHRELPVDVPDSFIEIVKTTPRYPPPPHLSSLSSQLSATSLTTHHTNNNNINNNTNNTYMNTGSNSSSLATASSCLSSFNDNSLPPANAGACSGVLIASAFGSSMEDLRQSTSASCSSSSALSASLNRRRQQLPQPQVPPTSASSSAIASGSLVNGVGAGPGGKTPNRIDELNGSVKPVPPPRDHLRIEKDGRLVNRTPAPQLPDRRVSATGAHMNINNNNNNNNNNNVQSATATSTTAGQQIAQIVEPTLEQLDSIKKYQVSYFHFYLFVV